MNANVYILRSNMFRYGGDGDHYESEVIGAFSSLEKAQERAQARDSDTSKWTEHNSHGQCWTANRGRMGVWTLSYTIEPYELDA